MKKLLSFLACLMLGVLPGLVYGTEDYYAYSYARMSYVNGDVFIQRGGDMGYEEGTVNLPIVENDKLGTQDGRAEIHFGKKNYLRIDRFTQLDFAALPKQGNDNISIHLLSGNVYLRVSYMDREKEFEVHTPDASYYILDVGLYRFSVQENQQTELRVLEGAAEAAGEEGSILIEANEAVIAANGHFASGPTESYASYEDDFASWNRNRDALITRYASNNNYLPEELNDYEYELSYHGRWVYERSYGYVWVPNVYESSWRPYWNGRWVWYPVIGWTWVSYEPWGWCVSHYGRWHWRLGLGWYWIPTAHWGPAWVHWYHGYDYYGWCPLSYYNRPVVIVNNYFYGNYYNDHYPVNSRALTVVHKSQLQNRNISRVALSSSSVTRLGKISLTNRQPSLTPVFNKTSLSNSKAARVLSRSDVRKVNRSFSKSASISGSSSSSARIRSQSTSSSGSSQIKRIPSGVSSSASSGSSRIIKKDSSVGSTLGSRSRLSSNTTSGTSSRTSIKTYPSSGNTSNRSRISTSSSSSSSSRTIQPSSKSYGINSRSGTSSSRSSSIRQYPSSRSTTSSSRTGINTSRYSSNSSSNPSRITSNQSTRSSSSSERSISRNSSSSSSSSIPSYPSRSQSSSYSSSSSASRYSPSSRSTSARHSSSSSYTSPSRSYSSRSSTGYSSGSRSSYSSPSRSSSSRYTAPSRSYSSSRSSSSSRYTSPSRSSSSSSSSRSRMSSSSSHRSSSSVSRSSSSRSSSRSSSSSRRRK